MTRRIFRSILGVSLAVLAASLVLVTGVLYGYVQDRVGQELAARAAYVARGVEQSGAAYLADLPGDSRITWVAADGTVLWDNQEDPADMDNHAQRQEIRQALLGGSGSAARYVFGGNVPVDKSIVGIVDTVETYTNVIPPAFRPDLPDSQATGLTQFPGRALTLGSAD